MKSIGCIVLFWVLAATARSETVDWKDIGGSVEIVGRLGVPLGTVVSIEATVISGADLHYRDLRLSTMRFLRVDSVDGVPVENPPVMHFGVYPDPESYSVPIDPEEARIQSDRVKMKSPEHAPIGTKFTLFAFESGGTPANPKSPRDEAAFVFIQMLPDPDPHPKTYFTTYLHVVAPKEEPNQPVETTPASAPH